MEKLLQDMRNGPDDQKALDIFKMYQQKVRIWKEYQDKYKDILIGQARD